MGNHSDRPNVLFIVPDDQGCWAMGCAGNDEIQTPNLDRLADEGMRFANFFCTCPVSSPARSSMLTGRIPSQHGVHDYIKRGDWPSGGERERPIEYLAGLSATTDLLAAEGYACGLSGKWHMGAPATPQKSFGYWRPFRGGAYYDAPAMIDGSPVVQPGYRPDRITDLAMDFLREVRPADDPFYLAVNYVTPHSPWTREHHPAETFDMYYHDCPFDSLPDLPMHPWQAAFPEFYTTEGRRTYRSGYFAAVTEMDRNIGRLLDELEAQGLRESTLVFFCGDNGMNMGQHGICGKGNGTFPLNMYDTSVKVPAIASMPGAIPEGVVCDELLSQYDIRPTLLQMAGIEDGEADALPGTSFASALVGEEDAPREDVVVFDEYGPTRMIRTREWKYVRRYPFGPNELYNLAADPEEATNLVEDPAQAGRVGQLRARMERWFEGYADPDVDGLREAVTGFGQTGLAGLRGDGTESFDRLAGMHAPGLDEGRWD
ncbi:MAG: sulfatase-like hydrolase/transferase [Armatimonadota bacterium]|jgi:choline-sulfatase